VFIQDAQYAFSNRLNTQLAYSWRGANLYDDMVVIWGAERDIFEGKRSWRSKFDDIYLNRVVLNSFAMSEDDMRRYIKILNKKRPKLIKAYAQSIYELAKFAKEKKIEVKKQKAIHLAAGTVYAFMRELIEDVFGCKAYNYYGSREVGAIASECQAQDGLHVMQEHTFLEVLNPQGEVCEVGEEGEIVVTTLENYSMPLIRYKIGDVGILQEHADCTCTCTYDKLQKVIGRTTDLFKTKDGRKIDGEYFTHLFYFSPWIKRFQVIQNSLDEIVIKIVKNHQGSASDINEMRKKIKLVMGEDCHVTFEYVDEISKTTTGKFRYTISNI
jgi:phenylacetate-CoA ligase